MADSDLQNHAGTTDRLEFLDGLRGVAAAMVVLHHLPAFSWVPLFLVPVMAPNPWVSIFITLSGFCLYLPAAGRSRVEMPRPFWEFMRRRARRIVPAWYASLALAVLTGWFLAARHSPDAPLFLPTNAWDLLTHLTLTHSMTTYSGHINGPGYTLGTEFQLYVLMIGLIAVAARAGWPVLVAGATLAYFLPGVGGKVVHHLFSPMFGMPFILGMIAARLTRRPPTVFITHPDRERVVLAAAMLAGAVTFCVFQTTQTDFAFWAAALATGAACVLMARRPHGPVARVLSSRAGKSLGGFSYSLYLTHNMVLGVGGYLVTLYALPPQTGFFAVMVPAVLVSFVFAYLFSLVFERPFLNSKPAPRPASAGRLRLTDTLAPDVDTARVQ